MRRLIMAGALVLLASVALAAGLPDGDTEAAGTTTLRIGLSYAARAQWTVVAATQEVSCQFKIGSSNLGGAIEVGADRVKEWVVYADSLIITRPSSTAVDWYVEVAQ